MVTGRYPYLKPDLKDFRYRLLQNRNIERFWELTYQKSDEQESSFYSTELKKLVNFLLTKNPHERPSIAEISEHDWMKGEMVTSEEVQKYFEDLEKRF